MVWGLGFRFMSDVRLIVRDCAGFVVGVVLFEPCNKGWFLGVVWKGGERWGRLETEDERRETGDDREGWAGVKKGRMKRYGYRF